jgi:transcriptional regulator with XRE-family HTH domain
MTRSYPRTTAAEGTLRRVESLVPIDFHLAARIMAKRQERGRTRKWLAEFCGVSAQQIERMETAQGKTFASRLFDIAEALEVAPGYFYEGFVVGGRTLGAYDPMAAEVEANPSLNRARLARMMSMLGALPREKQNLVQQLLRQLTIATEAEELAAQQQQSEEAGPKASTDGDAAPED